MSGKASYRLLIIDDDVALNELLREYLERFGHRLTAATTATDGIRLLRRDRPDLLILDVMLPDADGMEVCREIRRESDIPIVMLTARGDVPDRVLGLEFGADDYVPKPFEPRELVARIETLMRRSRQPVTTRMMSGDLTLDSETRRVELAGAKVDLTNMEFELLRVLMESRGRVLTRDAVLQALRGIDADVFDRSVDMLVSRLRRKLDDDSRSPRWVKTIRGTGYQFVGGGDGA
jgi:DNA-binding response OmpR family regulator